MKNEEEKNELFTLLCYELHFWYRGTLNLAYSKYIIILPYLYCVKSYSLLKVEVKKQQKTGFLTPTNYLIGAVNFDAVEKMIIYLESGGFKIHLYQK